MKQNLILGYYANRPAIDKNILNYTGDSHLITVAPTGSGKGRSVIIPNLLDYPGPIIILDPKGENYQVTSNYRRSLGQEVYLLDPFKSVSDFCNSFNPFDIFHLSGSDQDTDAQMISSSIQGGESFSKDPFWDLSATGLISGLIAYVISSLPKYRHNLNTLKDILMNADIRQYLTQTADNLKKELLTKNNSTLRMAYYEIVSFLNMPFEKTAESVLATAYTYMKAFNSDSVSKTVSESCFSLEDVKDGKPMTIYLVVPPDKLKSHASLLKLWINALFKAITSRKKRPKLNTLFMLDECAQLGSFEALEVAVTLLRGYGLQTWTFWQDLSQMKKLYPRSWPTILGNSEVIQVCGVKNYLGAEDVSGIIGMEKEKIITIDHTEQLLLLNGHEMIRSKKMDYLQDQKFRGTFDPNPIYEGK